MAPPRGKEQVKLTHVMTAIVIEELLSGPCTNQHLAEVTGMAQITVARLMRVMYRRGVVHISGWEKDNANRVSIRVYSLGHGRDAPKKISKRSEMNARYRANRVARQMRGAFAANDSVRKAA